jgi:hypothetical protein
LGQAFHGIFEVQLSSFGSAASILIFLLMGIVYNLSREAAARDEKSFEKNPDSLPGTGAVCERFV